MDASGSPQEDSRTVAASKAAAVTSDDKVQVSRRQQLLQLTRHAAPHLPFRASHVVVANTVILLEFRQSYLLGRVEQLAH